MNRPSTTARAVWTVVLALGTGLLAADLTVIFLAMRSVMQIGGSCASGGPYVVAQECPEGVGGALGLGIPLLFLFGGFMMVAANKVQAPQIIGLAWPALFISLGWNFLDFTDSDPTMGTNTGFLICGILFMVMGAGPLVFGFFALRKGRKRASGGLPWGAAGARAPADLSAMVQQAKRMSAAAQARDAASRRDPFAYFGNTMSPNGRPTVVNADQATSPMIADLERLANLRASGALTDAEFEAAKQAALQRGTR